jgi:glycine cleavage system H lipoate-binding protein
MSILFVLLTFIVVITINYFHLRPQLEVPLEAKVPVRPRIPVMTKQAGFSIPRGYSFHPGHTWVMQEAGETARIGLDKFGADLIGKIDRIEVADPSRWVRQGQRLATVYVDGTSFHLLSPVEGVIMSVNQDVVKDPAVATRDPYQEGWIAVLKSPDLQTNRKNLMQGPMVAPWMLYNVTQLNAALAKANPMLAQDGGTPVDQALLQVEPAIRQKIIKDFFLN